MCRHIFRTFDRWNLEYDRIALTIEQGQQLFNQEAIENLAVDAFPTGVRGAYTYPFRRYQQHAVVDAEVAAALSDELRKTRVPRLGTVNFFIYRVDQLQLLRDLSNAVVRIPELALYIEALTDDSKRRLEDVLQEAGIEPRCLTCIPGKQCNEYSKPLVLCAQHRQSDCRPARTQCPAQDTVTLGQVCNDFGSKIPDKIVDLVIVGSVTAPDTFT